MALRESVWSCPPLYNPKSGVATSDDAVLGWLREAVETGDSFNKSQRAWPFIDQAVDLLAGCEDDPVPESLSDVKVNRVRRNLREIVATLSNLRPTWEYKTDNRQWEQQTFLMSKGFRSWWGMTRAGRWIKESVQYAAVQGIGYSSPVWQPDFWTPGRGEIALKSYGPKDVLFVQLPKDHNLQRAYAVIVREEVPIALAHHIWPEFADKLTPTRDRPARMKGVTGHALRALNYVMSRFGPQGRERDEEELSWPTIDILTAYVMDGSINTAGQPLRMGEPGTTWEYEVPSLGEQTGTGLIDPATGHEGTRRVTREEARLFPLRRKIIAACAPGGEPSVRLSDGTATDWHGMVPLAPVRLDGWAWETIPFSLGHDAWTIQKSNNKLMRGAQDMILSNLRPKMQYDEALMAKDLVDAIDFRSPDGLWIPVNTQMGDLVKPLLDPSKMQLPQGFFEFLKENEQRIDHLMDVGSMRALAQARQIPSSDSVEKLREMAGGIMTDMSESIEASLVPIGEMWKSLALQYYNVTRRMQMFGQDGTVEEDWDLDPQNMVPSHLPGEDTTRPSRHERWQRAKWHQRNMHFHVVPRSAHQITQMNTRLGLLQLQKSGFPVDPWTMAEAFDYPNLGPPPETFPETDPATGITRMRTPRTGLERFLVWQQMQIAMKHALGLDQQGKGGGRPNSNQKGPQLKSQGNSGATTLKTS